MPQQKKMKVESRDFELCVQDLQTVINKLEQNIRDHNKLIINLEKHEASFRKHGLFRSYGALAKVKEDVNKRFESINQSGLLWAKYI